jgi:peptidoglycan L-alanyl-D-glutamate endopeptidase CwlK
MPSFGRRSRENLNTCDGQIKDVLNEAINHFDFSVIDGHRDMETQNKYYNDGVSKLRWPNSKHNLYPSRAVDIIPYPGGFDNDLHVFDRMATYVLKSAANLGVRLEWGGHWKNFPDYAHFELKD